MCAQPSPASTGAWAATMGLAAPTPGPCGREAVPKWLVGWLDGYRNWKMACHPQLLSWAPGVFSLWGEAGSRGSSVPPLPHPRGSVNLKRTGVG